MNKFLAAPVLFAFATLLAACAMQEGGLSSVNYQPEPVNRTPGHNLYSYEALDHSASQRVNRYSRGVAAHEQRREFVQRLSERQRLEAEAQKLGRKPGSLFRQ